MIAERVNHFKGQPRLKHNKDNNKQCLYLSKITPPEGTVHSGDKQLKHITVR